MPKEANKVVKAESATSDAEVTAINVMYDAWMKDFVTHGSEGYVAHFTDDGVLWPPKSPAIVGKEAVRSWIEAFIHHLTIQVAGQAIERVKVDGDVAYCQSCATGTYAYQSNGKLLEFDQKYLDILQRQADGTWKIAYHTWSSNNTLPSVWDDWWDHLSE
jgi:uncharacterized protein (TIGR02246 family)